MYVPDLGSVTNREELKDRTVFCYGARTRTHTQTQANLFLPVCLLSDCQI